MKRFPWVSAAIGVVGLAAAMLAVKWFPKEYRDEELSRDDTVKIRGIAEPFVIDSGVHLINNRWAWQGHGINTGVRLVFYASAVERVEHHASALAIPEMWDPASNPLPDPASVRA